MRVPRGRTSNGYPVRDGETVVLEERPVAPPPAPPAPVAPGPPDPERELWPWLLALLVLVVVGLGAAYLLTRKGNGNSHRAARATTTVVETQPAAAANPTRATSPTGTAALPTQSSPAASQPKPKPKAKNSPGAPVPHRVAAPNVLGISSGDAVSHLRSAGLGARVQQVYSAKPPGTVVSQSPDPSTKLAKGAIVTLQASKGPRPVAVPDVRGQDQQQAVAALQNVGLKARLVAVPSVKPVGTVVAQWPRPGAKLPAGRSAQVNVARTAPKSQQPPPPPPPAPQPQPQPQPAQTQKSPPPPAPVTVPDVTGVKLPTARRKLRAAGLVTEVKYVPSQEPVGTIVSQAPKPGRTLKRGDHVLVNASDASQASQPAQQASVPDVVGLDQEAATNSLRQAGFTVDVVDVQVDSASQDGLVQDEQPAGGTQAPAGSDVTLYVGRFSQTG
jgi:beta-lactam-binding protein with PASTA domain